MHGTRQRSGQSSDHGLAADICPADIFSCSWRSNVLSYLILWGAISSTGDTSGLRFSHQALEAESLADPQREYKYQSKSPLITRSTILQTNITPRLYHNPTNSNPKPTSENARFHPLQRSGPRSHRFCQPRFGVSHLPKWAVRGRIVLWWQLSGCPKMYRQPVWRGMYSFPLLTTSSTSFSSIYISSSLPPPSSTLLFFDDACLNSAKEVHRNYITHEGFSTAYAETSIDRMRCQHLGSVSALRGCGLRSRDLHLKGIYLARKVEAGGGDGREGDDSTSSCSFPNRSIGKSIHYGFSKSLIGSNV